MLRLTVAQDWSLQTTPVARSARLAERLNVMTRPVLHLPLDANGRRTHNHGASVARILKRQLRADGDSAARDASARCSCQAMTDASSKSPSRTRPNCSNARPPYGPLRKASAWPSISQALCNDAPRPQRCLARRLPYVDGDALAPDVTLAPIPRARDCRLFANKADLVLAGRSPTPFATRAGLPTRAVRFDPARGCSAVPVRVRRPTLHPYVGAC